MATIKPSSRYNSFDYRSSTQSHQSDPSSSTDLPMDKSRALVKTKSANVAQPKPGAHHNLSTMVKKFMERSSSTSSKTARKGSGLIIPADFIAEDLRKTARKGSNFGGLHRKLFGKGGSGSGMKKEEVEKKALVEVKSNTRTLAMVLRNERELLSLNKEQEAEITELKLMLEEKNREVEKLKDLCLKQREEIKSLKSSILFPEVMHPLLQEVFEKQGSELKQAKQLIPNLQRQVDLLTDQLQCLAEGLEEELSSVDYGTPGSPDDMFLKDLNPCLTPCYATAKSKDLEVMGYESPRNKRFSRNNLRMHENSFNNCARELSKSSGRRQSMHSRGSSARASRRSEESDSM